MIYTADSDGDGLNNFLESAYGGNPQSNDSSALKPMGEIQGNDFIFTFICDASRNDLTYTVQESVDLVSWVNIAESISGNPVVVIENRCQVIDSGVGLRQVKIVISLSQSEFPRKMIRLRVTTPFPPNHGNA